MASDNRKPNRNEGWWRMEAVKLYGKVQVDGTLPYRGPVEV